MAGRDVELLIHISAPSLARDDALYRSLATAYLDFQPSRRLELHDGDAITGEAANVGEDTEAIADQQAESQLLGDLHNSQPQEVTRGQSQSHMFSDGSDSSSTPDSQPSAVPRKTHFTRSKLAASPAPAVVDFSQASFASLDGHDSPRLRTRARTKLSAAAVQRDAEARRGRERPSPRPMLDSSQAPPPPHLAPESSMPCEIPDSSSQWYRPIAAFASPSIVMESFLAHFESSYGSTPSGLLDFHPSLPSQHEDKDVARGRRPAEDSSSPVYSGDTRLLEDHHHQPVFQSPEALDSSLSPSPTRQDEEPSPTTTSPPLHTLQVRTTPPPSSPPPHPPRKRPSSPPPSIPAAKSPRPRLSPDISRVPATPVPARAPRSTSRPAHPSTIHPPAPPTSAASAADAAGRAPFLPPPALARLAAEIGPSRYRPRAQTRPLRALERGYWRVEVPGGWDAAWAFLRGYVGRGRAGWGVWCWRGEAGEGEGEGEEWRVYCWGGVVAEVYLLLYLASARRVRGVGVCWVDGGGEVVVRMGGGEGE